MPPKGKAKAKAVPAKGKAKAKAVPAKGKAKAKAVPAGGKAKAKATAKATPSRPATPAGAAAPARGAAAAAPALKRAGSSSSVAPPPAKKQRTEGGRKVDSRCPTQGLTVADDYSVTLNQTNVGENNNKFYIIQALEGGGKFYAWNRWGRVGDDGKHSLIPCASKEQAVSSFMKKFREKTCNDWSKRDSFTKHKGKYTIVEVDEAAGGGEDQALGKLTEAQIEKGQVVLEKLSGALKRGSKDQVTDISSEFYSLIPHNFGWKKPVAITTMDMLTEKQELLKFFLRMGFEKIEVDTSLTPIAGVMDLPVPKSLDDAAQGICQKSSVDSCNKKGRELAAKQAGGPNQKMSDSLYGSIMLYTSNAIYADLNKALRDQNRVKVKRYFKYLRLLFEAMEFLPRKKRTLWRGLSVDLFADPEYAPGKTITWWGVSSCTADEKVARGFAQGCGSGCTVVTIHCTTSCDISEITFFSNEKESLLRPGTQLKVKSRTKKGNVTELVVEEVGCAIG